MGMTKLVVFNISLGFDFINELHWGLPSFCLWIHTNSAISRKECIPSFNCLIKESHRVKKNKKWYTDNTVGVLFYDIYKCDCFENKQNNGRTSQIMSKSTGQIWLHCYALKHLLCFHSKTLYWNSYFIMHCNLNLSKMTSSKPLNQHGTTCSSTLEHYWSCKCFLPSYHSKATTFATPELFECLSVFHFEGERWHCNISRCTFS